jgi:hypothetical protein
LPYPPAINFEAVIKYLQFPYIIHEEDVSKGEAQRSLTMPALAKEPKTIPTSLSSSPYHHVLMKLERQPALLALDGSQLVN